MLGHQCQRVSRTQHGGALGQAGRVDPGHRNPLKFDLLVQGQRGLPQVAAVRALGIKENVDRVGTHECPNGEALGSLGHGLDG